MRGLFCAALFRVEGPLLPWVPRNYYTSKYALLGMCLSVYVCTCGRVCKKAPHVYLDIPSLTTRANERLRASNTLATFGRLQQ